MNSVMLIAQNTQGLSLKRCLAMKTFLDRLSFKVSQAKAEGPSNSEIVAGLDALWTKGLLIFKSDEDAVEIWYLPSTKSKQAVYSEGRGGAWPGYIVKGHEKAFRKSAGALFRLPLEDAEGEIQAFITDWSPFPAAAAVAVHPDHLIACKVGRREGEYFTGLFARHPLTGRLATNLGCALGQGRVRNRRSDCQPCPLVP